MDADGNWEFSVSGADIVADDVQVYAIAEVLPAAGATNAAVRIGTDRLAELIEASWVDVCQ